MKYRLLQVNVLVAAQAGIQPPHPDLCCQRSDLRFLLLFSPPASDRRSVGQGQGLGHFPGLRVIPEAPDLLQHI